MSSFRNLAINLEICYRNNRVNKPDTMIAIVIPARNESSVIARTLRAITAGVEPSQLDVIVVCNGCTDDTAAIARKFGPPVRVVETDIGSKTHALNLGDQTTYYFPRIYIDADVLIDYDAIHALASRLEQGDVLAVAPLALVDLNGCSWFIRAYYDIRSRLPSAHTGIGGSGVYALSLEGRRRFGPFPDVTSDDGYVRIQFKREERETLASVNSIVFAPRTIRDLINIRTRARYGTMELAQRFPELWRNAGERNHKSLISLFVSPFLWPKLLAYSSVNIIARFKAILRIRSSHLLWERDNTSRKIIPGL